jgi:hypothetical protein
LSVLASCGVDEDEFWFLRGKYGDAIAGCLVRLVFPGDAWLGKTASSLWNKVVQTLLSRRCVF